MSPNGWTRTHKTIMQNMGYIKTFRFDDVCINADIDLVNSITDFILQRIPNARIIFGVSPLVHSNCGQRVYPEILNAFSDHKKFYSVNRAGIPDNLHDGATLAGHGLIHVDHRLLSFEAQEMSILISCALVNAKTFIPPFNKWNSMTEHICNEHNIKLVKFEDGWLSMEHNIYNPSHCLYYLHARAWTLDKIVKWFNS